jgi:hypothetical protein
VAGWYIGRGGTFIPCVGHLLSQSDVHEFEFDQQLFGSFTISNEGPCTVRVLLSLQDECSAIYAFLYIFADIWLCFSTP